MYYAVRILEKTETTLRYHVHGFYNATDRNGWVTQHPNAQESHKGDTRVQYALVSGKVKYHRNEEKTTT